MNSQQFNGALAVSITEALKGCAKGEMVVAQLLGVMELHKAAVVAHVQAMQAKAEPTIIPFNRLPRDDGRTPASQ
jgi:hypothetical protein